MRIERVVIENLNSLRGRFEIDLNDRAFSGGLFAIVGPSGAGKTTVLDAICLALYGKTPRIDTVSETQDELMNKSASGCKAEVVFSARGKRYKSVFVHERSRGSKPFRAVKRELLEATADGAWQVIAARIREVDEKVADICGLDYGRFTRSIMLAQFRFAEFLQADSNDRAAILEQITDMDIYRRISIAVYERTKAQRERLASTRLRIDSVTMLSEAQEAMLKSEMRELETAVADHDRLKTGLGQCVTMAAQAEKLDTSLKRYQHAQKPLEDAAAARVAALQKAAFEDTQQLKAQAALQKALKVVRELDLKMQAQADDMARIDAEMANDTKRINEHKNKILDIFKKYEPHASGERYRQMYESETLSAQLRKSAKADLDAVQTDADSLRTQLRDVLAHKEEAYWQARRDAFKKALPVCEARDALSKVQADMQTFEHRQRTLDAEQAAFEAAASEIKQRYDDAQLEQRFGQERRSLVEGEPCPLCGALHHPKAGQTVDETFIAGAKAAFDEMQRQRDALSHRIAENSLRMADTKKLIEEKTAFIKAQGETPDTKDAQTADAVAQAISDIERMLRAYSGLRAKLDKALEKVAAVTARFNDVDKDVDAIDSRRQMIAEMEAERAKRRQQRVEREAQYEAVAAQRQALFGSGDADKEEEAAGRRVSEVQAAKEKCRLAAEQAERALEQNRKDIERTKADIEELARRLEAAYAHTAADAAAIRSISEDEDVTALYTRFLDAADGLGAAPEADALVCAEKALGSLITAEAARLGSVKQILETNEQSRSTVRELKKAENKYKKELEKWEKLNALIGSSAGDKFSRMAQSITFDALLRHANRSLARMSDRYVLKRDDTRAAKPLELAVIDTYQAGEQRPVSNLSGGESFIVSLALALGLSEMSSGAARIDSLFIDEGFASLDEDYMEAALQTLSALGNREGKLIGVISHVEALKSRIEVQIEVRRRSGGCAELSGPGVTCANA